MLPARRTVSTMASTMPALPMAGVSIYRRDMFSLPKPLGRKQRRTLSPGTISVCREAGVLSAVLTRVRGSQML